MKETIEEAAKNYANYNEQINKAVQEAVKFGAKWQAERMYSEEDMKAAWENGMKSAIVLNASFEMWLEQFKNK
jgi:hypothetical protein